MRAKSLKSSQILRVDMPNFAGSLTYYNFITLHLLCSKESTKDYFSHYRESFMEVMNEMKDRTFM